MALLCVLGIAQCSRDEAIVPKSSSAGGPSLTQPRGEASAFRSGATLGDYDRAVLSDQPVAFWNTASGIDLTSNGHNATAVADPQVTLLPNGDRTFAFNGTDEYLEAASSPAFSVSTTGVLTLEAWVRPDVLDFTSTESTGYVNWMGKGTTASHEYTARMYTRTPAGGDAGRTNRISGSVFSPNGTGSGSYYQADAGLPIAAGEWIHYILVINTTASQAHPHGYTKLCIRRQDSNGILLLHEDTDPIADDVTAEAGNAPFRIGTKNMKSYFAGAIGKVAVYNYELGSARAAVHAQEMFNYDSYVLADHPVAYWNDATAEDLTLNEFDGVRVNNPGTTTLPNGNPAPVFDLNKYIEIASAPEFSVPTTGVLTVEAWMRPDKLAFDKLDGTGYVHWMGKGTNSGEDGNQEYVARMYGLHPTGGDSTRHSRISGYAFNPQGGEGAGSYYQADTDWPIQAGEWIHFTLIINANVTSNEFPTGFTKLYIHRRESNGTIVSFTDKDALVNYNIAPQAGPAPFRIGTRNLSSYFQGAIGKVAIYNYELSGPRSLAHARKMLN